MEAIFQAAGYTITTQPEQADVIVLNTCTVTASGDSRMYTALRRLRAGNPDAVMVLTGKNTLKTGRNRLECELNFCGLSQKFHIV